MRGIRLSPRLRMIFLLWDEALLIGVFVLFGYFRPDLILLPTFVMAWFYIIFTKRTHLFRPLLISSALAFFWVVLFRNHYGYNQDFISVLGINFFPLFAWALGLFVVYMLFSNFSAILKLDGFWKKLSFFTVIYWILLLLGEKIGYELFNIRNLATAHYSPLPICQCLHAPVWMQASYLFMGPLFFILCYFLMKPSNEKSRY
ncbi:hypothetical protein JW711_03450 [Candidatus Woesearchaeota archaeon]|nr:hypothetical protein [Candidatus Woesearchaeota archaeon]